jgi:Flp pilus assembly protein TadG
VVEVALTLPIVMLFALAIVEIGVAVSASVTVEHAAREGARAAAVSSTPSVAARRAVGSLGLAGATVATASSGDLITVTVSRRHRTDLPLIGRLVPDPLLSASVTMRRESSG